jgi:hypothetical protein
MHRCIGARAMTRGGGVQGCSHVDSLSEEVKQCLQTVLHHFNYVYIVKKSLISYGIPTCVYCIYIYSIPTYIVFIVFLAQLTFNDF